MNYKPYKNAGADDDKPDVGQYKSVGDKPAGGDRPYNPAGGDTPRGTFSNSSKTSVNSSATHSYQSASLNSARPNDRDASPDPAPEPTHESISASNPQTEGTDLEPGQYQTADPEKAKEELKKIIKFLSEVKNPNHPDHLFFNDLAENYSSKEAAAKDFLAL